MEGEGDVTDASGDGPLNFTIADVIPFPGAIRTTGAEPFDPASCSHFGAKRFVDVKSRIVYCGMCDAELDAMDCMIEIAEKREGYEWTTQGLREEAARVGEELDAAKKSLAAVKKKLREERKRGAVADERQRMLDLTQGALDRFCSDVSTKTPHDFANAEGMLWAIDWVARGLFNGTGYPEFPGLLRRIAAGHQELDARRRRMNIRPARGWDKRKEKQP